MPPSRRPRRLEITTATSTSSPSSIVRARALAPFLSFFLYRAAACIVTASPCTAVSAHLQSLQQPKRPLTTAGAAHLLRLSVSSLRFGLRSRIDRGGQISPFWLAGWRMAGRRARASGFFPAIDSIGERYFIPHEPEEADFELRQPLVPSINDFCKCCDPFNTPLMCLCTA